MRRSAASVAALVLGACASVTDGPGATTPDPLELSTAIDTNPAPDVVEVALTAREAEKDLGGPKPTRVWTYNGTMPGPMIDAKVGDELVARFTNTLPEPTLVHWHGVRLPAAMDGSPSVQAPVRPGESFEYRFRLKDAGLFWFHPHVRTGEQVERGLAGVLRVRGEGEPDVDDERVLVLDDVKLGEDGQFPTYVDDASKMLGREADTLLVNGVRNAEIRARPGALQRFRIVNVANGRFFHLKLEGAPFVVIGTDGGRVAEPYTTDTLLVAPAERYDVVVRVPRREGDLALTTEPYERGHDTGKNPAKRVATVRVRGEAIAAEKPLPSGRPLTKLPAPTGAPVRFVLDEGTTPSGELTFTLNGKAWPDVPAERVGLGEVRTLELENHAEMDHPFHVHGTFFQVLSVNGVPAPRLVEKDTVIVPMKGKVTAVARFDAPGAWMVHCHINEHSDGGMMGEILVGDAVSKAHGTH
ncbi:MAG: multicopper oxidase family protein [Myxococcales bacterium]|nr:multicopper oxidase family protein [Myxococcales bacterium]